MSSGSTRSPVDRQIFPDSRKRIDLGGNKNRQAELSHHLERIRAIGSDANRRIGLLHRFGNDRHFSNLVKAAMMGNTLFGPGLPDDVERLQETLAAFGLRDAESLEMFRQ